MRRQSCVFLLVTCASLATGVAFAEDATPPAGDKQVAGMSILGNDEAPKSLVIVPWKSSDMGSALAVAKGLDAGREPVDRKVFVRSVDYYEIRAGASRR
ncbi:MAG: hypothetical protein IPK00_15105 [Deltaproteobacteria bacterium]|nr:hypothetical protein [Deltaproteobacteria bacterium]